MQEKQAQIATLVEQYQQLGDVIFLESQKEDHPASEKSYLAAQPKAWIKSFGDEVVVSENGKEERFSANPWDALQEFRAKHNDWLFGYFSYDLKNHLESLESKRPLLSPLPDMYFMDPTILEEVHSRVFSEKSFQSLAVRQKESFSKEDYRKSFKEAQRRISEGDFYEINLSYPIEYDFDGLAFDLYQRMKKAGPVPFGAYLAIGDVEVCSSSPERFLAKKGSKVWAQPIKGTSPNFESLSQEDVKSILHSEKNRAENLMIVDLVRNDLSRIAKTGSVAVKDLFEIQTFDTVHQLVSTVECEVDEHKDPIEIIKACFPMGSMTGAPKISAMNAIEELETYKRGIYSGAIGYINPINDFDFNVVIRSAIIHNQKLVYPVGGAITSDSELDDEWNETLVKARALTRSFK